MKKNKKTKRKIKVKGVLLIFLVLYLFGTGLYFLLTRPIKTIIVLGNKYTAKNEIIETAGLKDYPSFLQVSSFKISKQLRNNKLIKNVIIKKSLFGKIEIRIEEYKPLFINALNNELVLSSGETIPWDNQYLGLPTLINYVPNNIYQDLIAGFAKIEDNIICKISEIEYSPDRSEDIVFDEARFLLRMNDHNSVYINTPNITKLNNYNKIFEEVGSGGTLLLDSNSQNYIFNKNESGG